MIRLLSLIRNLFRRTHDVRTPLTRAQRDDRRLLHLEMHGHEPAKVARVAEVDPTVPGWDARTETGCY